MGVGTIPTPHLELNQEERDRVRAHLESLLVSAVFKHSQRSQSFLRYIVDETLAGRGDRIKERNIGVDVFGKAESFDPQEESLVRVCAGEVRKRIAQAYLTDFQDGVRIELPVGSYAPSFNVEQPFSPQTEIVGHEQSAAPESGYEDLRARKRMRLVSLISTALLCAGISIAAYFYFFKTQTSLDRLWQPFARHGQPVLIVLPTPTVLEFNDGNEIQPGSQNGPFSPDEVHLREGYFTGIGASLGAARFAEQLALRHQSFTVKFGLDASFPDLSAAPTILLGGFSSPLGQKLLRNLRYRLTNDGKYSAITDTFPNGNAWRIPIYEPTGEMDQGYALVTILHNSDFKQPVLLVAGLTAIDTASAAEFLTDNDYFVEFTSSAPKDWYKRNCQIVIHSHDYGSSPGKPQLVTWYVW